MDEVKFAKHSAQHRVLRTPECSPPPPSLLTAPTCQPTTSSCLAHCGHLLTGLRAPPPRLLNVRGIFLKPQSDHTPPLLRTLRGSHLTSGKNQRPHRGLQASTRHHYHHPSGPTLTVPRTAQARAAPGPLHLLSLCRVTWLRPLPHSLDGAYHNGSEYGHLSHQLALRTGAMSPALFSCL